MSYDVNTFDVEKYDAILAKGLSLGLGSPDEQVCIEAAICQVLGLPHGDDPKCVASTVRSFKIRLNDSNWSSPKTRARGLRDLGLAQLGSLGVVEDFEFSTRLAQKTIQVLLPELFRDLANEREDWLEAANQCEKKGSADAAYAAADAAYAAADAAINAAASAANNAARAANNAAASAAYDAASAAINAADAARAANNAARAANNAARAAASAAADAYAAANAYAAASAAADAASAAINAAYDAASAAADAASAAINAAASAAINAAARAAINAARAANNAAAVSPDKYLILSASLALEVLRELNSPGIKLLEVPK